MSNELKKVKINILKRMLGTRVFVLTNSISDEGYCGIVSKVVSEDSVIVSSFKTKDDKEVSIFDIRTPSRIYNCE